MKFSENVLPVELHEQCKNYHYWMIFAQVTLFVKTVIKKMFTKAYFLAFFGAFHHLRSANLVEITSNFLVNFLFICWLYRTPKNHEFSTLFALISFLQRNVFFLSFLNFQVKITPWRWYHNQIWCKFLIHSYHVDFKNIIGFGLAIWEGSKPFWMYLN